MKQKKKKTRRRLLSFLLTLAMVIGLMPGMGLTAYAEGEPTVNVSPVNSGTVSIEGYESSGGYPAYHLTANPAEGYRFVKWTYNVSGSPVSKTENPWNVMSTTLPYMSDITAVFEEIPLTYSVTLSGGANATTSGGATTQNVTQGQAMTAVTYTANDGYYFPTDYSVTAVNGISVTRDSDTQITVSGTPNADTTITLTAPTAKTDQEAPTGLTATKASSNTATDGKISGVTVGMEYQKEGASTWTAVGNNETEITGLTSGTYKVRYAGTADKNASTETTVQVGVKEDQTAPTGLTATKASSNTATDGKISGVTDAMEYQKDGDTAWTTVGENKTEITGLIAGTYKVRYAGTADKNASTETTVQVGVKTDATVTKAPTAKSLTYTGSAQELVTAGEATGGEMQYALGTATEATQPYTTSIPTATDAGTYYIWYMVKGDTNYSDSVANCVVSKIRAQISKTVTFKVANGSWDDGTTADKKVTLTGYEGDTLKLTAAQIPAAGSKPGDTYQAGSWDVTPSADTAITADTTYTYTYAKAEVPTAVTPTNRDELSINAGFKVTQSGSKITVKWGKVEGATGYEVYVQYCGKSFSKTPAKRTTTKTSAVVTKINGKKINLKKNFKVYVKAIKKDGSKSTQLAKTITGHIVGRKNTKYTNAKSITLTTKTISVKVGKTSKIKAKTVIVNKKKKQLGDGHAPEFRYASSDKSIATVDKNGKVTGVSAGTTKVYVYSRNGLAKAVSVTVK